MSNEPSDASPVFSFGKRVVRRVMPKQVLRRLRGRPPVEYCPLPDAHLIRRDGVVPDFCAALNDPVWLPASEAQHMRDDDAVLGFAEGNEAWAFPWWIMKNHHVANLTLAGRPRFVAFCEACATAGVYDPIVDGTHYTFRIEGSYNGSSLAIDDQTGSYWAIVQGRAVFGPALGTSLERSPIVQETWAAWKALYPHTLVLDGTGESRTGHGSQHASPDHLERGFEGTAPKRIDDRVPLLDLIVGVITDSEPRAYPLSATHRGGGLVHDEVGGVPVVVLTKPGTWLAVAFDRRVDGRTLEFVWNDKGLADTETGSHWDLFGEATSGPLAGCRLAFVPSGLEKWYGWAPAYADKAMVWSPDGLKPPT